MVKKDMSKMNIKPRQPKKILFLVTEDWYFCSHRLKLACSANRVGFDVVVATRVNQHGDEIVKNGFKLIAIRMRRRSSSLFSELMSLVEIFNIYRRERPDIVHHVALKPVLFGSLVAVFFKDIKVVNAIAGLGFLFISENFKAKILRIIVTTILRILLKRPRGKVIVQNLDDGEMLVNELGLNYKQVVLIRGSGVDLSIFRPSSEPDGEVVVVLVARMLWDKGIGEFVKAVQKLKENGLSFRAVLVGSPDIDNPSSITITQLERWSEEGYVEWKGFSDNIVEVLVRAHVSVLPSYREGLPKSLIESAACGRPIVTTDTPGCREIVENNVNGLLVPPRDVDSLADAMSVLIQNKALREEMGMAGRKKVENYFSEEIVIEKTLSVYNELLK